MIRAGPVVFQLESFQGQMLQEAATVNRLAVQLREQAVLVVLKFDFGLHRAWDRRLAFIFQPLAQKAQRRGQIVRLVKQPRVLFSVGLECGLRHVGLAAKR